MKCNAVFDGGGVKGIGLVGAIAELEKAGYEFQRVVGTSAGAIVSALIAVGYTGKEIKVELLNLDYLKFKDEDFMDKLGTPGKLLSIITKFGIYEGAYFEKWLHKLLEAKGKTSFKDIKNNDGTYKFQAIASDITDKKIIILPNELDKYGFDIDKFSIAKAVRMSMSIPLFFEPYKIVGPNNKTHYIVDGGLLSNYPIWLLDEGGNKSNIPTIGFKLIEDVKTSDYTEENNEITNIMEYMKSLVETMIEAHDKFYISRSNGDYERTITIKTEINKRGKVKKIKTTDFEITKEESLALYQNGVVAATKFLRNWSFVVWKEKYQDTLVNVKKR